MNKYPENLSDWDKWQAAQDKQWGLDELAAFDEFVRREAEIRKREDRVRNIWIAAIVLLLILAFVFRCLGY